MKEISTQDMAVGQPDNIIMKDGTLAVGGVSVEPVEAKGLNKDMLDELAFMEEEIEVMVHETSDENAPNPVTVGCNGVFKQFFRGFPTVSKRKFVDCLIVKSGRVKTDKVKTPNGEDTFSIEQRSAHQYPFNVIVDKNPKGAEWLRRRMADKY